MLDLYLLVLGQDQAECDEFSLENVDCDLHIVTNEADRSMASIANWHLKRCQRAVFGLIHPDVSFGAGGLEALHASAAVGNVCGVVGAPLKGRYRWCYANPGKVSTLDDCSVFFRPDSGLRFDAETCDTFYAYVSDLCLQAHAKGIPVVVPSAQANHKGKRYFTDKTKRQAEWHAGLEKVREKWPSVEFTTT